LDSLTKPKRNKSMTQHASPHTTHVKLPALHHNN